MDNLNINKIKIEGRKDNTGRLKMVGCLLGFGRLLLVLTNTLVIISALAMAGIGVCTLMVEGTFDYFVYGFSTMQKIKQSLKDTGLGDETSYDNLRLDEAFVTLAMAFTVSGGLAVIIGFIGCCGGCCRSRCLLTMNAFILIFLLIFEIIVVILLYSDESVIRNPLKLYIRQSIAEYKGFPGDNAQSFGWNFGMVKFNCCGVIDYEDFEFAKEWVTNVTTASGSYDLVTPVTCCSPLPSSPNLACASTTVGNNAFNGCFDTLWNLSFGHAVRRAVAYGGGFTLQVLLIIFSILLCLKVNDKKIYPLSPKESLKVFYQDLKKKRAGYW